ncbi:MAG: hypothetical protein HYY84_13095, partial [Deltaproteobacteria bacterium]|nr:hypothetical protein [Deltaproteobacteria bacterium]
MKTKIENKKVGRRFTYTILLLVVATSQLGGSCDVKKKVVSEVWVKVTHATDDAERLMDLDKIKKLQIFAKSSTTPLILDPTSPACQKTNYAPPNQAYDGFTSECIDTDFNGETDFSVQFHSNPLRGGNDFGFPLRNDSTDSIPFGLTVRLQGDKTDTLQTLSAITCDSGAPIHFSRELCVVTFNFKCEPGVTCKIVPKKPLIPPLEARRFWVGIESRIVVAPYDLNGDTDLPVTALMKGANDGALRPLSDFGAKLVLSEQLSPSPGPPMWNFIWTPTNDHLVATPYEVQFRVSDPSNLFSTTSVAITIEENASPWFPRPFGRQQLRANDELTVRFPLPTDPEDQDVEVSIDWNSSRLPPTAAQTDLSVERINFEWVFKWKTKFGQENENEWQVVFALNDGYNVAKEIGLVKIDKVSQPPRCPAVTSDGFTMGIADETLLSFQGSDPDGDTIQYSADFRELLKYATVQAGPTRYQRLVKAIPGKFAALSTVDIPVPLTLFDGTAQVSCNFTLTINAVNPPPACPSIADKSVHAFETVVIDFEATDPNGDTLVVTTDRGTYDAAAKRVTWTPNATFVRDEAWIVKVTADDGTSKCSSEARVTVLAAEGAANGEACTASQSCASRECVAGICCATACDAATSTCATGTCKLNVGQTCTVPSVCASGKCYQAKCCQATTCAVAGKNCGTIDDGCGGVLNCGSCGAGQLCVANVCGCTPESDGDFCARVGATCGSKTGTDNCGASRTVTSCGSCTSPETCLSNVCACTPTTCTAQGKNCGSISDGCGGTLNCGTCSGTGQSCVSNVCSCTPDNTTACAGKNCGSVTNNCGQTVSCGTCSGTGESCVSNVCSCTPDNTTACAGKNCGSVTN